MAKVVVFGSTGFAGSNIAAELTHRGHEVVGVSRSSGETAEGVASVTGSIFDEAFVREVTADAQHIVVALPATARQEGEPNLIVALPAVVSAALAAGARLGVVGGAGSLAVAEGGPRLVDTDEFPAAFVPEARAHGEILDALRGSDDALDWFYLSPAATFGSWNPGQRTGTFRLGGDVLLADAEGTSAISGADYAIAFVDEIEQHAHPRARFSVAY